MPILSSTAASSTEPAVGAVVWAGGQPGVQREDRHLDRQAGDEQRGHEHLGAAGQPARRAPAARAVEVGVPAGGDEGEDADAASASSRARCRG